MPPKLAVLSGRIRPFLAVLSGRDSCGSYAPNIQRCARDEPGCSIKLQLAYTPLAFTRHAYPAPTSPPPLPRLIFLAPIPRFSAPFQCH